MRTLTLAAFSNERRIAAVALFRGLQCEEVRIRHLPLDDRKAAGVFRKFVSQTLESHEPEFVAISSPALKAGERVRMFCSFVREITQESAIPSVEVEDGTLMKAYGHPPLTRKEHVRRAGLSIWPSLKDSTSKRAAVDAAVCGLYVQTERLFSIYEDET